MRLNHALFKFIWEDSVTRMIGEMQIQNFYMLVGVVHPKLDCESGKDVNVNTPTNIVGFNIVGIMTRKVLYGHKPISDGEAVLA